MLNDKAKIFCLVVFALSASGCGSGSGGGDIDTPQVLPLENTGSDDGVTTAELTVGTDTSESTATPVLPVSTVQMDEFVENPLVTPVPTELAKEMSVLSSNTYVNNPLIH